MFVYNECVYFSTNINEKVIMNFYISLRFKYKHVKQFANVNTLEIRNIYALLKSIKHVQKDIIK